MPPKKIEPTVKVEKKSSMGSAYSALSPANKKLSHQLEFESRPTIHFDAETYLFHATATSVLKAIQTSGLKTRDGLGLAASDASKDAFISAATSEKGAGSLSSKSSLLRFKPTLNPGTPAWKAYGAAGEVRTMSPVSKDILEVRINDVGGVQWVRLQDVSL